MGKTLGYGEITVANMTEPFTVMLTNEAQQFATDSNRKVTSAQSYYTDIIVIRGSQERTDYTIGNIASGSGITVSKSSKRVTFSVSAGTTIGADTGVIEIPITLDGQTVKKQFSWSCGKQGPQGVKGQDGNSFSWNMLSETNCGKKHWGTASSGGKYSVESETTEDNIEAVKLICTESVSSSGWSYTCFTDLEMLKQLKPSTKYTLSYDIKANRSGMISHTICRGNITNSCTNTVVVSNIIGDETWQHISVVLTTNDLKTTPTNEVVYLGRTALSKVGYSIIKNLKLTEGYIDTPWSPSQSDIEGKGIVQIVQYYLATSQASGVTSSTSGWSTDITTQKITADKKYLWNCSQTRYTDGTSEPITTPTIIGAYGDKGETGANGQDGAGFHWNLLKYSGDLSQMSYGKVGGYIDTQEFISDASTPSKNVLKSTITTVGNGIYIQGKYLKKEAIKKGNTYTVSAWCKCSSAKDIGVMNVEFLDKKVNISMPKLSTEWQQYIITGVANKDVTTTSGGSAISFYYGNKMAVGDIFYISSPKVEEGDKPSPWCTTYEETLAKNLTITPSSQYFKSTDGGNTFAPNQITITPTLQGDITFGKWQYSIDGGVSFADVVSGQKGLMTSNNVLTVSKDSSLYSDSVTMVTFRAVASDSSFYDTCSIAKLYDVTDIEIGGVNLIKNSNFADGINKWVYMNITCAVETDSTYGHHIKFSSSVGGDTNHRLFSDLGSNFNHVEDTMYTLSFYAKASANTQVQTNVACTTNKNNYSLTTSWQRFTFTYQASAAGSLTFWAVEANKDIYLANIKLERGNKATDWTPAPEDVQTAILSTKNSIENVSSKVDTNTKSIQDKVSKTTYETDLKLVKGDLSKANDGLNKWRYEIYPKSLFESEDQGKSTIDIFARNLNLVPTQTVLLDDASLSTGMNYGDNHIAYALTFVKMSTKKDVTTKMFNDDGASLYVNGKLIGSYGIENTSGHDVTFTLARGWNCIEVVVNEEGGLEGFRFSTTLSKLSECQMMNCYYGTPVARQSRITNQLVDVTKNLTGVTSTVQDVMTAVGNSGNITEFKNNYSKWKQNVDGIESRVGSTYVTNEKFDGLEIGGRNLLTKDDCNMSKWQNLYPAHCKITSNDYSNHVDYVPTDGQWEIVYKKISVTKGQKYILSFDYKINKAYNYLSGQKYGVYLSTSVPTNAAPANIITNGQYVIENTVTNTKRGMIAFTAPTDTLYIVINGGCIDDNQTGLSFEFNKWKLEKGNKATDWTPAPEDVNGKIQSVETIATQTADKFSWLVKSGTSSSNFKLTDRTATLVAEKINYKGLVTFNGLSTDAKNGILNSFEVGGRNLALNTSNSYSTAFTSFNGAENTCFGLGQVTCKGIAIGDVVTVHLYIKYTDIVPASGQTARIWTQGSGNITLWNDGNFGPSEHKAISGSGEFEFLYSFTMSSAMYINTYWNCALRTDYIVSGSIQYKAFKVEKGNKATDWTPAPEDVSQDATNKASQALSDAKSYSSSAVDWVTNNGSPITNLNSMVKKWTDGAVSDTAQINGGWIKANTITANKIAIGDFTNYADINESNTYWFRAEQTKEGTWFYRDGSELQRDNVISELHTCRGGEKFYVEYDISNTIKEGDEYKYAGLMIFGYDGNGGIVSYNRNAGVTATANGEITHITTQLTMPDTTRSFRVYLQIEGHVPFTGTLKIRNISVRKAVTGNLIVDGAITADKIATDSIKSRNYISSGGTQGSFLNLSDGSFTSPNLSWDSNGNLIAKNANLSGEITAINGTIGKYEITDQWLTTGSGSTCTGMGGNQAFWAGGEDSNSAPFRVGYDGKLTSSNADITGTITATNGKIGRYDITSTYLMTNSGSNASGIGGNQAFWAGAEDSNSAPFRVGYDGVLWAENAAIRGSIETGNLGDEGDTVSIINGHIGIRGTSNNVEIYSTGFKFGIDGDYYLESVSEGVKCYRNLYATDFVADGWVYCSEVHSSGAVVIGADSESFYWAHGYQIGRGTSWGGVCLGDDSQQLRLYGSSIWASHSISTSDENLKENFTTLDQYEDFYMNLNPIGFNYIGDYDGKKTHFGFGAHKTEDILESEGYDADKFAVVTHRPLVQEDIEKRFGKDVEVDIETEYGVSYTEFIALNTHMIQKTRRELTKVKQEKANLEARLQVIEAKLGL